MTYISKTIIDLLSEIFGFPKRYSHNQENVPFNCPKCDHNRNKYNLEVNLRKNVFNCWSCGYKGRIKRLFFDYANDRQKSVVKSFLSKDDLLYKEERKNESKLILGSFRSLSIDWKDSIHYYQAKKYLLDRGITNSLIKKWDIAYSEEGPNKHRVIIPSRSTDGKLNYFIARSFYDDVFPKYKNPSISKNEIIFGEKFVDWSHTVILTEGVFDSIIAINAVPILGSHLGSHKMLIKKIINNKTPIIICFDYDAWDKSMKAYKTLEDLGVDVKIIKMPKEYGDLSNAYSIGGKEKVLELIDSAHSLTLEEIIG